MTCVSLMAMMIDDYTLQAGAEMTITLRSLRAQQDGAEILLSVVLESGGNRESVQLPITAGQYYALKPQKGPLTEEQYEALEEASRLCRAIRAGEYILSFGANTARTLAAKLMRKGYSRQVANAAAEALSNMGLINEAADVKREVDRCLAKLWGKQRIMAHLWSKGYTEEALAALPGLLEEVDFTANCATMIVKHYGQMPTDPDDRRRMVASLARYGYTMSEIRAAEGMLDF